jgi:hypothetical protein
MTFLLGLLCRTAAVTTGTIGRYSSVGEFAQGDKMTAVESIYGQLLNQDRPETYFEYFRLTGPPFQSTSVSEIVYLSRTHREGLAALEWSVSRELNGFTLLTGEPGSGKTTLIYTILQRDFEQIRIAYIVDPKLSFLEILRAIFDQLKLYSAESTKLGYLKTLDLFLNRHRKDGRVAIIIDEAQDLSDDALEELRLLSNHGQRNDRCLQLILVRQLQLAERLKRPALAPTLSANFSAYGTQSAEQRGSSGVRGVQTAHQRRRMHGHLRGWRFRMFATSRRRHSAENQRPLP